MNSKLMIVVRTTTTSASPCETWRGTLTRSKLPRTPNHTKGAPPFERLKDDRPFVAPAANDIREFRFPDMHPAHISKSGIRLTVLYATKVTALVPNIRVSADATVAPESGVSRDFTTPQTYTVTARDGSTKSYTVTFDQSGTGLLKFTSDILISGYSHDMSIVLTVSTAGSGEIAGAIVDPHDRAEKAVTSVTKSGTGTWTLSGINTYSGSTTVSAGKLSLAHVKTLGAQTEIAIENGAILELKFNGQIQVRKLTLSGKPQRPRLYNVKNAPGFIKGTGMVTVLP
jgi:autotransporter-associated beta strand protein